MSKKIVLGENKMHLNYMNNVCDENYSDRVVAHLTFEYGDDIKIKNRDYTEGRKKENIQEFMKHIRDESIIDITFSNKKSIDDMIENLIKLRDKTEWDWRREE